MNEQVIKFIKKCVWVAISAFVIRCSISHVELIGGVSLYSLWGYAGEAIGFTTVIMLFYEKHLWKYNPLEDTPRMKKTYAGTLKSTYDGVERQVTIKIKQSLLSISISLKSEESESRSVVASITNIGDEWELTYTYYNVPLANVRERSSIHYGTSILSLMDVSHITGQYFTDRKTTGDMDFLALDEERRAMKLWKKN